MDLLHGGRPPYVLSNTTDWMNILAINYSIYEWHISQFDLINMPKGWIFLASLKLYEAN